MNTLTKDINEESGDEPKHVDDFIYYGTSGLSNSPEGEDYARFVLNHFRAGAMYRCATDKFMKDFKLFCEYRGKKYRVTGASRLGDVWLHSDFERDSGYTDRVGVTACSKWSAE